MEIQNVNAKRDLLISAPVCHKVGALAEIAAILGRSSFRP
jgi:hypothetical protein